MIYAGTTSDVSLQAGPWIFFDVGFSSERATCGLLIDGEEPSCLTYGSALARLIEILEGGGTRLNLVVEAPLSIAFTAAGNPTGRSVEVRGTERRYWYTGLGASVMVAAMYAIQAIRAANVRRDVRLFEGLASFKQRGSRSSHVDDVLALREIVRDPARFPDSIVGPESLRRTPRDILRSAGAAFGFDFGIPPLLSVTPHR